MVGDSSKWRQQQFELEARALMRKARIDEFAGERGWKSKYVWPGMLVPGHRWDMKCRPPHMDHSIGFWKDGKAVAFMSQPYKHVGPIQLEEMRVWAAPYGLKMSVLDMESFHNPECLVLLFEQDMETPLWQAVTRMGTRWVGKNMASRHTILLPLEAHDAQAEWYKHYQDAPFDKRDRRFHVVGNKQLPESQDTWRKFFFYPMYRGRQLDKVRGDMIQAVLTGRYGIESFR